jgi:drug/metabolite transporter (DMT)-like permease
LTEIKGQQHTAVLVMTMLVVDSFHLIFARALAPLMSAFHSSFFVLLIATLQVASYLLLTRRVRWQVLFEHRWFFLAIGALVAAATLGSYTAVFLLDAGTASLLGRVSTVITLALSVFWLKERLSNWELLGAALCIAGAFTISFQSSNVLRLGSLLILLSVTFYALHIAIVKRFGDRIEFANFFLWRLAMTTLFLFLFGLFRPLALPPSALAWALLLLTASVDVVLSRILYYWLLRRMRLGIHTIALTLTPVLTVLWSILLFAERPTWQALAGGMLVLTGVLVVADVQRRKRS